MLDIITKIRGVYFSKLNLTCGSPQISFLLESILIVAESDQLTPLISSIQVDFLDCSGFFTRMILRSPCASRYSDASVQYI